VNGQQANSGAITRHILVKQFHTLKKVICLLDILLGLDWAYVLQCLLLFGIALALTCPGTYALPYFTAFRKLCGCGTICITQYMDEIPRTLSPEPSAADAGKWIGRVMIAVILAEGIWGFLVSITNNLILPLLARIMGADAQSPLYLGKGDFNVPALFTAVLELCFAAIVAVILNSWVRRNPKQVRTKSVRVSPLPAQPTASAAAPPPVVPVQAAASLPPPTKAPAPPAAATANLGTSSAAPPPSPGQFWSPPEPSPQPKAAAPPPQPKAPAKPAKPKEPKEVYYNIVGEPINPTEDE